MVSADYWVEQGVFIATTTACALLYGLQLRFLTLRNLSRVHPVKPFLLLSGVFCLLAQVVKCIDLRAVRGVLDLQQLAIVDCPVVIIMFACNSLLMFYLCSLESAMMLAERVPSFAQAAEPVLLAQEITTRIIFWILAAATTTMTILRTVLLYHYRTSDVETVWYITLAVHALADIGVMAWARFRMHRALDTLQKQHIPVGPQVALAVLTEAENERDSVSRSSRHVVVPDPPPDDNDKQSPHDERETLNPMHYHTSAVEMPPSPAAAYNPDEPSHGSSTPTAAGRPHTNSSTPYNTSSNRSRPADGSKAPSAASTVDPYNYIQTRDRSASAVVRFQEMSHTLFILRTVSITTHVGVAGALAYLAAKSIAVGWFVTDPDMYTFWQGLLSWVLIVMIGMVLAFSWESIGRSSVSNPSLYDTSTFMSAASNTVSKDRNSRPSASRQPSAASNGRRPSTREDRSRTPSLFSLSSGRATSIGSRFRTPSAHRSSSVQAQPASRQISLRPKSDYSDHDEEEDVPTPLRAVSADHA